MSENTSNSEVTTTPTISMGVCLIPILRYLRDAGDGAHPIKELTASVVAQFFPLGTNPSEDDLKKAGAAVANAGFSLRQRLCMTAEGRAWKITDLGLQVANGVSPMPKAPSGGTKVRVNKPRTGDTEHSTPDADPGSTARFTESSDTTSEESVEEPSGTVAPEVEAPVAPKVDPVPSVTTRTAPVGETISDTAERILNAVTGRTKPAALTVLPGDKAEEDWVHDPYLRSLCIANTDCFASWSPGHKECGNCPIAAYCRNAQAVTLSLLSDKIKEKEIRESAKILHEETAKAMSSSRPRTSGNLREGYPMIAPSDGLCRITGRAFSKGEKVLYVKGQGAVCLDAPGVTMVAEQ